MDIEKLLRRAEQAALPDPHDEREVMNAPILRELHDALLALHRHAEAMSDYISLDIDEYDKRFACDTIIAAYRADFPRKP